VLQRVARALQRDTVGARVDQQGLRLQDVALRDDAGLVTVARDGQRALVAFQRRGQQGEFGVGLAQLEVA
jgi:hypothetical protein